MMEVHNLTGDREVDNAQRVWSRYKKDILTFAQEREKIITPRLVKLQQALQDELVRLSNERDIPDDIRADEMSEVTRKLGQVAEAQHRQVQRPD
jgi:hypothetical protein